jgi:hypothetical protein
MANARDFGARGDGESDDTAALQAAISAAQGQGRALAVPAGNYTISAPLVIKRGAGVLRMYGESMYTTVVSASANFSCGATFLSQFECAVLHLPGEQTPLNPPWTENYGKTTSDHEISHIQLYAANIVKYGIYAPLITRSRFIGGHLSAFASIVQPLRLANIVSANALTRRLFSCFFVVLLT